MIPGGRYLRLRLIGDAPGVYGKIAAAFDELFEDADDDPTRPLIEFYRREGEVDCLVPVNTRLRRLLDEQDQATIEEAVFAAGALAALGGSGHGEAHAALAPVAEKGH